MMTFRGTAIEAVAADAGLDVPQLLSDMQGGDIDISWHAQSDSPALEVSGTGL